MPTAITNTWYTYERGTDVYEGRPTEWIGKIGLMYASDFGYATNGGSTMDRESCLNTVLSNWSYPGYSYCQDNDWLYDSSNDQWTLTPFSSNSYDVCGVRSHGAVLFYNAGDTYAVSPAIYLSSNVKISGGEGTEDSPFTLSL